MHGEGRFYMEPKGHIVLDKYPGEWEAMPSYIEEPEAAACKWVSIREQNRERFDLPTVFSILIYTHPETGFPARDLRRLLPHGHAHRRLGGGLGEVAGAQGLEGARDRRRRPHGRRRARDLQRGLRLGGSAGLEPLARRRSIISPSATTADFAFRLRASTDLADVVTRRRRRRDDHAGARADRAGRVDLARDAHRRGRRRQGRRSGTRPAHPPARPDLRRRHPPVPHRRRDQRPARRRA